MMIKKNRYIKMLWCLALFLALALIVVLLRQSLSEGAKGDKKTSNVLSQLISSAQQQINFLFLSPQEKLDDFFNRLGKCGKISKTVVIKHKYDNRLKTLILNLPGSTNSNSLINLDTFTNKSLYDAFETGNTETSKYADAENEEGLKREQYDMVQKIKSTLAYNCPVNNYLLFIYYKVLYELALIEAERNDSQSRVDNITFTIPNIKNRMLKYINKEYQDRFYL